MPSLIVMRGTDRLGPFQLTELADLIDAGVLLPEDACAPEEQPSQIRPISWWLASAREQADRGTAPGATPTAREASPGTAGKGATGEWRDDPLFAGRMPLGGDTPVGRRDPPAKPQPSRPRERQLYRGRPAILAYAKSLILIIVLTAGIIFASDRLPPPWTGIALTLMALILSILSLHRYTSLYLVTNRRVELVEGLVARSSREVRISDIRAINVSRKGLLGLLGIGTVEFASAGSDDVEVTFKNICSASGVKHLVRNLQESP